LLRPRPPGQRERACLCPGIQRACRPGEVNPARRRDSVIGLGEKQFMLTPEIAGLIPDAVRNLMLSEVW
jgi:hypothetical protein